MIDAAHFLGDGECAVAGTRIADSSSLNNIDGWINEAYGIDHDTLIEYQGKDGLQFDPQPVDAEAISNRSGAGIGGKKDRLLQFDLPAHPVEFYLFNFQREFAIRLRLHQFFNQAFGVMVQPNLEREKDDQQCTHYECQHFQELLRNADCRQGAENLKINLPKIGRVKNIKQGKGL